MISDEWVITEITNVRIYIKEEDRWVDIGYEGPVSFDCKEEN